MFNFYIVSTAVKGYTFRLYFIQIQSLISTTTFVHGSQILQLY